MEILEWQRRQKHHEDIKSLGPDEGIHKLDGFIYKFVGSKVQVALKRLGHDSWIFETCKCQKGKSNE